MIVTDVDQITPENIEHILKRIVDEVGAYIYVKDAEGKYIYANKQTCQLFNCSVDKIQGTDDSQYFSPSLLEQIIENDQFVLKNRKRIEVQERNQLQCSGKIFIYKSVKIPLISINNEVIGLCGVSTDITDLYNTQKRLQIQANTDSLTLLSNRRYFLEQVEKEISRSIRHNTPLSLIIADIDHFKHVNDNYGHDIGDEVLVSISNIFKRTLRKEDIIGRIGGEEFALLLPHTNLQSALKLAERIREDIAQSSVSSHDRKKIKVTISMGATDLTHRDNCYQCLYRKADEALYKAKEAGRNKVCI
ncbi:sensor domain-containing diguanylate cyclase [Photobacterium kasasachensis]|uniref:sensor domain-containing diguanylate cyclase n=2 Tax=Photobacterium TaxID=657 RepID=UPI003D0B7A63